MLNRSFLIVAPFLALTCAVIGCGPQAGPDKTIGGAVLGAGWGAGAGAIVGNQVDNTGPGMAVGAGFGAVSGAISGATMDSMEPEMIRQERELRALSVQNMVNSQELMRLQAKLDEAIASDAFGGMYQVFFDGDQTNLRSGSIANLETIADSIKGSPYAYVVNVVGHSDDSGAPEQTQQVAEARARSVASYLGARGVSMDQIVVKSFGSTRPIASNTTETGRQLNRRVDILITRKIS